jgi:hypothetical protein
VLKRKVCEQSVSFRFCTENKVIRAIYDISKITTALNKMKKDEYGHIANLNSPNTSVIAIVSRPPYQDRDISDCQASFATHNKTFHNMYTILHICIENCCYSNAKLDSHKQC